MNMLDENAPHKNICGGHKFFIRDLESYDGQACT